MNSCLCTLLLTSFEKSIAPIATGTEDADCGW
jgi:hypothetical protein